MSQTVAGQLVNALEQVGVKHVFGLIGDSLNPLADASRKGDGNVRFEVVQQTSRPNHFTVVEAWKDRKAYDARGSAGPQRAFRDKLGPMLGALYDERIYRAVD